MLQVEQNVEKDADQLKTRLEPKIANWRQRADAIGYNGISHRDVPLDLVGGLFTLSIRQFSDFRVAKKACFNLSQ